MSAGGPRCGSGGPVVEPEADLHGDLEVTAPVVLDAAPHPGDLEPVQVVQGPRGAADGALDRVVDALGGGADNLTDRIHVVCHRWSFPAKPRGTGQVRPPGTASRVVLPTAYPELRVTSLTGGRGDYTLDLRQESAAGKSARTGVCGGDHDQQRGGASRPGRRRAGRRAAVPARSHARGGW